MAGPSGWGTTTSPFSPRRQSRIGFSSAGKALAKITLDTSYTMLYTVCTVHYMEHSTSGGLFENLRLELRPGCLGLAAVAGPRRAACGHDLGPARGAPGARVRQQHPAPLH